MRTLLKSIALLILLTTLAWALPNVTFVSPTPANASTQSLNYIYANVSSAASTSNHSVFLDWNNSLLGWWSFDFYNSTVVFDNSTYNQNATITGFTTASNILSGGQRGQMLDKNGSDSLYINASHNLRYNFTTPFTIMFWMQPKCSSCTTYRILYRGEGASNHYQLGLGTDSTLGWFFLQNGSYYNRTTTVTFSNSTWYHIAVVWTGSTTDIYVNGINRTGASVSGYSMVVRNYLALGGAEGFAGFNGSLDEFMIFNRSLTNAEINASYNATAYQYSNNFTGLNGTYYYRAWAIDEVGGVNNTGLRQTDVSVIPNIAFVSPTPANATIQTANYAYVNVSTSETNGDQHSTFLDWNYSLLGWWSMDFYNSTVVYDNSTRAFNASFSGNLGTSNITTGVRGNAIKFDGNSSSLNSTNMNVQFGDGTSTGGATLCAWVRMTGCTNLLAGVAKRDLGIELRMWSSTCRITGRVYNSTSSTGSSQFDFSTGSFGLNIWTHICTVQNFTGTNITNTVYVNAVLNKSTVSDAQDSGYRIGTTGSRPFYIGIDADLASRVFNGSIDEVMLFNRTLSPAEINATYNSTAYQYSNNFTGLGASNYYFKAWAIDAHGQTNSTELRQLTVDQTPAFQWTQNTFTNGSEYRTPLTIQFFANFTDDNGTSQVNLTFASTNYTMVLWNGSTTAGVWNYNITGVSAGTYYYNFTANDGALANTSQTFSIVIAKNSSYTLNFTLNNSAADLIGAFPMTVHAYCNKPDPQTSGAKNDLYRNGTNVATSSTLDYSESPYAAQWNWTCVNVGDANYSYLQKTFFANISKGSVGITALLNGAAGDRSYTAGAIINASGWKNVTDGNLTLYRNGTSVDFDNTYVEENNQTSTVTQTFNYTTCFPEAQNYSATCTTRLANFEIGGGGHGGGGDVYTGSTGGTPHQPTPTPKATPTPSPKPKPPEFESRQINPALNVSGIFGGQSTLIEMTYTSPSAFFGDIQWTIPFEIQDYNKKKITISPRPTRVEKGSIIAKWENVKLEAKEKFKVKIELNGISVDKGILQKLKPLTLIPKGGQPNYGLVIKGDFDATIKALAGGPFQYAYLLLTVVAVALLSAAYYLKKRKGLLAK